jgi:rhodanese-related sulfurtransferase
VQKQNYLANSNKFTKNRSLFTICNMSCAEAAEPRKAGVASPSELKEFVNKAGSNLLVVDVRHPDSSVEPSDAKSFAVAGLPNTATNYRPKAINLPWSRENKSMPDIPGGVSKDTPIITHCGGGGRGQKAKDYLESKGFTKVLNGGGPKESECWAEYGDK